MYLHYKFQQVPSQNDLSAGNFGGLGQAYIISKTDTVMVQLTNFPRFVILDIETIHIVQACDF